MAVATHGPVGAGSALAKSGDGSVCDTYGPVMGLLSFLGFALNGGVPCTLLLPTKKHYQLQKTRGRIQK